MKKIASADNARFKALLRLAQSSRERKKHGLSLLDGIHLVAAYQAHIGEPVQIVVSEAAARNPEIGMLLGAGTSAEPILLSNQLFNQLSTVATPTGIMATVETPRPPTLPKHIDACVMLEDIQDPGNLGSILRAAAAAGLRHVLLSPRSVHAWSPRVLRAGMGAHFMLQIYEQCDLQALMRDFDGRVIATAQRAPKSVFATDLTGRVALVFGNEGAGLSPDILAMAHQVVAIPMPGPVESLNIAAAAAVCLFERVRQQHAAGDG